MNAPGLSLLSGRLATPLTHPKFAISWPILRELAWATYDSWWVQMALVPGLVQTRRAKPDQSGGPGRGAAWFNGV